MCTKTGGAGISLRMVNNFIHLFIIFNDIFILHCLGIQRMQYLKKSIRNIRDLSRVGALCD
jgi:hypothetical protein